MPALEVKEIEPVFEAFQYAHDDTAHTGEITEWLTAAGYPLLMGDPELPEEMKPADEEKDGPGDKGWFIEPNRRCLVVRSHNHDYYLEDTDYIVKHPNGAIGIIEEGLFWQRFVVERPDGE